jgi:hypothetical protein
MQLEDKRKERILGLAAGEAIKGGLFGFGVIGAGVMGLTRFNPKFNKMMQVSAKVSLPVMAGLFLFTLRYEHAITDISRRPEEWGLTDDNVRRGKASRIPIHHKAANFLYDHPFGMIMTGAVPIIGYIFNDQMQYKHLKFSQRVMHSRVFAQGSIITMALTIMAFREWMDRRGRFPEP